ncbi:MAG: hypothetical protein AAFQ94_21970 [Bacteroidota bacterium]
MKKLFLMIIALFSVSMINAQDWDATTAGQITTSSKIGIGTNTPRQLLTVSDLETPVIRLNRSGAKHDWEMYSTTGGSLLFRGGADGVGNALSNRFTIQSNGYVGVGTSTPRQLFTVSDLETPIVRLNRSGAKHDWEIYSTTGGGLFFRGGADGVGNSLNDYFTIQPDGNLGIGTTDPTSLVHVFKRGLANGQVHDILRIQANTEGNRQTGFGARINFSFNKYGNVATGEASTLGAISVYDANNESSFGTMAFATKERYDKPLENKMWLNNNGSLGIGTSTTGTHKLAVEGSVGSREVVVESSGWSDFVFADDYHLQPLEKVEEFINDNNHLPEIPSEAEVLENGIKLGEMDAKLLQKIEELTLHMIEMNKRVKLLEEENKKLKAQQK